MSARYIAADGPNSRPTHSRGWCRRPSNACVRPRQPPNACVRMAPSAVKHTPVDELPGAGQGLGPQQLRHEDCKHESTQALLAGSTPAVMIWLQCRLI